MKNIKANNSPEQLRAWSHMVKLKTHDSLDVPPDKPFFRGHKCSSQSPSGNTPERKRFASSISINLKSGTSYLT